MDNELCQKRPPWLIAATVKLFTPREFRQALTVELLLTYTTLRQYLIRAVLNIRLMVADNAREAFDVRRHAGDVLSIIIAYCTYCWMTMSIGRLAAILAVAIPTLIWRDAHKLRKPSPWDPATDGFLVAATVLVSQSLLFPPTGSSRMAWFGLLSGTAMSTFFVSGWRFVFPMKDPLPEPALQPYRRGLAMTLLWLIGGMALLSADRQLLSSNSHLFDFVLGTPLFPVFMISLKLRAGTMSSLIFGPVIKTTLMTHEKKEDLRAKMNRLFRTEFSGFWSQFFERMFFVWIAFPMAVLLLRVALGTTPAESVNWMLWVSTAGGYAVLCKTWIEVKKINDRAYRELAANYTNCAN